LQRSKRALLLSDILLEILSPVRNEISNVWMQYLHSVTDNAKDVNTKDVNAKDVNANHR